MRRTTVVAVAVLLAAAAAIGVALYLNYTTAKPSTPLPVTAEQLVREMTDTETSHDLLQRGKLVAEIEPGKISLSFKLAGAVPIVTREENEVIARAIVQVAINVLTRHGFDPSKHRTVISAYAMQPSTPPSPTGKPLVHSYGAAAYDPDEDRIVWLPIEDR